MKPLLVRAVSTLSFVLLISSQLFAHDVSLSGTQSFASIDGSASDHDGAVNGVFTVNDGNLTIAGVVNCNDDSGSDSACSMTFNVSGNLTVANGGGLYAENRTGSGVGGAITLLVGGNLTMAGNAIVSTASKSSSGSTGGAITANVAGNVSLASGTTIDSGASNARGGSILIGSAGSIEVNGNVLSGPSRTLLGSRLTGAALDGGTSNQIGGSITIASTTFAEPSIVIGSTANVVSQGETSGAGPVTIDGCGIQVNGLVAALSRKDATAKVAIRSGKDITIDGRDLDLAGGTRKGRVRADAPSGSAINKGVDIFATETIAIYGPATTYFAVTSLPGLHDSKSYGGTIRITSIADGVVASGNVIDDGHSASGDTGGSVSIEAKESINLHTAVIRAVGDFNTNNPNRGGGSIAVRSYSGSIVWTNGIGEVRPVGSTSGLTPADQGSIVLKACGSVTTTGSSFPVMGVATSVFPDVQTGVCSPAAPSLPVGTAPLVTCNTPPVANDAAVSTNEDTSVTITLSGSDVDGDPLTFSIVSGPAKGSLGPVVPTGPTSATVNYTPNLHANGSDSFVFQANDGNGGTDNATVSITIVPVNDAPSFLAGASVSVLEDSGAQTFAGWASSISAGPADEAGQTVTFSVANDNPALFSVQPTVSSNGTLTFSPATNAFGSATVTIVAQDNGGTANGGVDTSASQTSTIVVTAVNDAPSFAAGANQSVNEDSGAQSVSGWATGISAGPGESQGLTFLVSSNNAALFSVQPSIAADGTLTYTPAGDANGSATVTVSLKDDGGTANGGIDTSAAQSFTISVQAVNDAPSFTSGGDVSVLEDSGAYSASWATAISAGPADESSQSVNFVYSNDNASLFSVQPAVAADGTLTFTVAANAFGTSTVQVRLTDNGGVANGGDDESNLVTFTITVGAVNDEPSFTSGPNVTVNEDSGAYSAAWASAINAGAGESQTLTFLVSNDNNGLFATQPSIDASGVLTFTTAANANGGATVTVSLQDDGGTANGGDDTSASVTFTIQVDAVNDEPSFISGGNVSVNEDSGTYSAAWATGISAGPANESSQSVAFVASNNNNGLFSAQPSVSASGVLTFTLAANATGSATVTVSAQDDGGTANGGDDTSASQTFTITVNNVNDAPSFVSGGDVTVNEDGGAYSAAWATAISAGPGEGGQTVSFTTSNSNNALFSVQPSISATGVLSFTSAPNAFGTATVSVFAQDDGGTANGGVDTSATVTFTITVNGVNDGPATGADSWETAGNTELRVDVASASTPNVVVTTLSGTGVLHNDADTVEGDPISVTGIVGCADVTAPYVCAVTGGTVTMNANGSFAFQPSPGATTAGFQYIATDAPAAGTPASANGTVTIVIKGMIWYVNGSAPSGGNGTSSAPHDSLGPLNMGGDIDGAGHTIFVHDSTLNGGIVLEANQRLIGERQGLTASNLNGVPSVVLVPAGARPKVFTAGDTVSIPEGGSVFGMELNSSGGNGIDITTGPLFSGALVTMANNVINGGAEALDINGANPSGLEVRSLSDSFNATGNGIDAEATAGLLVLSLNGSLVTSTSGDGVRIQPAGGSITIENFNVHVTQAPGGAGVRISDVLFDANAATGAIETVTVAAIRTGTGGPIGAEGAVLSNVSGDVAFTNLAIEGTTSGLTVTGTGLFSGVLGFRITSAAGAINAVAGTGLSVTNATIGAANLSFTSVSATGGVNGIIINNTGTAGGLKVLGGASAGTGGTLRNQTGAAVVLTQTAVPSFSRIIIDNPGTDGITATNVQGLSLLSSTVSDTAGTSSHDGVELDDATGAITISGSAISGFRGDNLDVVNLSGSSSYALTGTTFSNAGNNGINFTAGGTSVVSSFVLTGGTLAGNFADGAQVSAETGAQIVSSLISGNAFTNNNIGVDLTQNGTAAHGFEISTNTFSGHAAQPINIFSGAGTPAGGTLSGKVLANTIGNAAAAGSGSVFGNGVRVNINGGVDATLLIDGNTIRQTPNGRGIEVVGRNGNGGLDVTVTNNNVDPQDTSGFPLAAIFVQSNCLSVCNTVRTDIRGNVVPAGATTELVPTFLSLVRSGASTLQVVDVPPASATCSAQLAAANTGSASASAGCTLIAGPISTP